VVGRVVPLTSVISSSADQAKSFIPGPARLVAEEVPPSQYGLAARMANAFRVSRAAPPAAAKAPVIK
jgi:hypothetical protein